MLCFFFLWLILLPSLRPALLHSVCGVGGRCFVSFAVLFSARSVLPHSKYKFNRVGSQQLSATNSIFLLVVCYKRWANQRCAHTLYVNETKFKANTKNTRVERCEFCLLLCCVRFWAPVILSQISYTECIKHACGSSTSSVCFIYSVIRFPLYIFQYTFFRCFFLCFIGNLLSMWTMIFFLGFVD